MQAEMLDTVVSSNSQELFNFNAEHNGEACIESLDPKDKWTERQFWFTVAMLCVIYGVAERTLRDNLESIINDGELVSADFRRDASILDISGVPHKTTIYNLEVLNKLGWKTFPTKLVINESLITSSPTIHRRLIKPNSSHRGRLLLTPCNAKRAEQSCAQPFGSSQSNGFFLYT